MTPRRQMPLRAALLLVVVASSALGGCGKSGVQYIKNSDRGLFVKVPSDWQRFDIEPHDRPDSVIPRAWQVFVDADPEPTVDHLFSPEATKPSALVEIVPLVTSSPRDDISLTYLRALTIDPEGESDPLALIESGSDNLELVAYDEMSTADGYWGNHIVINVKQDDGSFATVGQTAMVDPELNHLYRIAISCASDCYDTNRQEINRIFDSWTIEER